MSSVSPRHLTSNTAGLKVFKDCARRLFAFTKCKERPKPREIVVGQAGWAQNNGDPTMPRGERTPQGGEKKLKRALPHEVECQARHHTGILYHRKCAPIRLQQF